MCISLPRSPDYCAFRVANIYRVRCSCSLFLALLFNRFYFKRAYVLTALNRIQKRRLWEMFSGLYMYTVHVQQLSFIFAVFVSSIEPPAWVCHAPFSTRPCHTLICRCSEIQLWRTEAVHLYWIRYYIATRSTFFLKYIPKFCFWKRQQPGLSIDSYFICKIWCSMITLFSGGANCSIYHSNGQLLFDRMYLY